MRKPDAVLLLALLPALLTACSSTQKKPFYLDSRLAAPLHIPAGLDAPESRPGYQLPDDVSVDNSGRISGAGDRDGKDIERPPQILTGEN